MKSSLKNPALFLIASWVLFAAETSWIEQYVQEATAANKTCTAKEFAACRDHLLRAHQFVDGRVDIVYRLASVEASLGNQQAALDWLSIYSKSGLTFADPASEPEFGDSCALEIGAAARLVQQTISDVAGERFDR